MDELWARFARLPLSVPEKGAVYAKIKDISLAELKKLIPDFLDDDVVVASLIRIDLEVLATQAVAGVESNAAKVIAFPAKVNVRGKDLTRETIRAHQVFSVPPLAKLAEFLKTKPVGLVFDVDSDSYDVLQPADIYGLFREAQSPDYCKELSKLLFSVQRTKSTGHTEFSWIHYWDSLIFDFIELFCLRGVRKGRTTNRDTSTDSLLPDLVAYLGRFALFRGEEEPEGEMLTVPKAELKDKLVWTYEGVPYVLAYYAAGPAVVLAALHNNEQGEVSCLDLVTFNLDSLGDRIALCLALFNVARLLPCLEQLCLEFNAESDIIDIPETKDGKKVEIVGDGVVKYYRDQETYDRVCAIYKDIKGCRNVEQLVTIKRTAQDGFKATFRPRYLTLKRARPVKALVSSLKDIAEALKDLHSLGYMHRDLHWRNVGYNPRTGKWGIFDLDEAARFPCDTPLKVCHGAHAKETIEGCHDYKVDIWALGHLIRTAGVDISGCPMLMSLKDRCLQEDPSLRPEIDEVLSLLET